MTNKDDGEIVIGGSAVRKAKTAQSYLAHPAISGCGIAFGGVICY